LRETATHLFEIDLGVQSRIADQVDDPPLAFVGRQPELLRQIP
jgi:hypothetical protein